MKSLRAALLFLVIAMAGSTALAVGDHICDWTICGMDCFEAEGFCWMGEEVELTDGCYIGMLSDCIDIDYCCEEFGIDGF